MRLHHARSLVAGVAVVVPLNLAAQRAPALAPDVSAACRDVFTVASGTPGAKTQRSNGTFSDETFRAPIAGCRLTITGSFKKSVATGSAADRLGQAFESWRWQELPEFSSDGHDGTSFAFRKGDVACFVRGEWDGGADDEPEIPAADPYKVTAVCGKAALFVRTP